MSDKPDIVERLMANLHKYPGFQNLNTEAATEIERLRKLYDASWAECQAWRTGMVWIGDARDSEGIHVIQWVDMGAQSVVDEPSPILTAHDAARKEAGLE